MTMELSPQLSTLKDQFVTASDRATTLVRSTRSDRLIARPPEGGWSAVECLIHLNLTSKQYIPLVHSAIQQAEKDGLESHGRFRMDWTGRFLSWFLEPPYRMRGKTSPDANPDRPRPPEPVLEEFRALNVQMVSLLEEASALAMDEIRVVSPFNAKLRYNLYSTFRILTAHERRHLWQAERVLQNL